MRVRIEPSLGVRGLSPVVLSWTAVSDTTARPVLLRLPTTPTNDGSCPPPTHPDDASESICRVFQPEHAAQDRLRHMVGVGTFQEDDGELGW